MRLGGHRIYDIMPVLLRYHLVFIVPTRNGTTQLDYVLVSPFGLFIVETKNRKGWIFGPAVRCRILRVLHHPVTQSHRTSLERIRRSRSIDTPPATRYFIGVLEGTRVLLRKFVPQRCQSVL